METTCFNSFREVLSCFTPMRAGELEWTLIAEMEMGEIRQPSNAILQEMATIGLGIGERLFHRCDCLGNLLFRNRILGFEDFIPGQFRRQFALCR